MLHLIKFCIFITCFLNNELELRGVITCWSPLRVAFFETGNRTNTSRTLSATETLAPFSSKRDTIAVCFFCVALISGVSPSCNNTVKEKVKNTNKMHCNIFFLFIFESARKSLRSEYGNRICWKMCLFWNLSCYRVSMARRQNGNT